MSYNNLYISPSLYKYLEENILGDRNIQFIYKEDFNGDKVDEYLIGYNVWKGLIRYLELVYIYIENNKYSHKLLLSTDEESLSLYNAYGCGIYDDSYVIDTTGGGRPHLVLGLTVGNGHYLTPFVFYWKDENLPYMWRYYDDFYHGKLNLVNTEKENVFTFAVEWSEYSDESIFEFSEAGPHIRKSYIFKWNGKDYEAHTSSPLRREDRIYTKCASFLSSIWNNDFKRAYEYIIPENFLYSGDENDNSIEGFKSFVEYNIMPILKENLEISPLTIGETWYEGGVDYCTFYGKKDIFTIALMGEISNLYITSLDSIDM